MTASEPSRIRHSQLCQLLAHLLRRHFVLPVARRLRRPFYGAVELGALASPSSASLPRRRKAPSSHPQSGSSSSWDRIESYGEGQGFNPPSVIGPLLLCPPPITCYLSTVVFSTMLYRSFFQRLPSSPCFVRNPCFELPSLSCSPAVVLSCRSLASVLLPMSPLLLSCRTVLNYLLAPVI